LAQIHLVVFEKTQKSHTLIPKNDVTEPKAGKLAIGYSNNQLKAVNRLKDNFRFLKPIVYESLTLTFNLLTV